MTARSYIVTIIFFVIQSFMSVLYAQKVNFDSVLVMEEVHIYPSIVTYFKAPASVSILNKEALEAQAPYTLVPAFNSVPGVRMEERSPGSYRLAIRGSLLRSPFGIRNIKVYIDEFPLTDAGGNTYLNSLDPGSIQRAEILKGPDGSMFGANTGGVVLLKPINESDKLASLNFTKGAFGLIGQNFSIGKKFKKYQFQLYQAFQTSDGYRENSRMERKYLQLQQHWNYTEKNEIRSFFMYSDLNYQTPGGLTQSQYETSPRSARPATSFIPGSVEQKTAVGNRSIYFGILHDKKISLRLKHIIALYGNHTNFKNPFITNFETRKENTVGLRTYFSFFSKETSSVGWKWNTGIEWQKTFSDIRNYGNRFGNKDTLQTADYLNARQYFIFSHISAHITNKWMAEAAISFNNYCYNNKESYPLSEAAFTTIRLTPQLMPRIATSYQFNNYLVGRASISRGYSTPTIAEIRPSDQKIYTDLAPEYGWNYEAGFRIKTKKERFSFDGVLFYFNLRNAIVKQSDNNGNDFYVNAGATKQPGIELQLTAQLLQSTRGRFIQNIEFKNSCTYYNFIFKNYKVGNVDYSGNRLTGVPRTVIVSGLTMEFLKVFYTSIQHNYTSEISLNDASTVFSKAYHLLQVKAGVSNNILKKYNLFIYAGVDNLLNQKYSLGNDLNAIGGRYFNAAPTRNFYVGMAVKV